MRKQDPEGMMGERRGSHVICPFEVWLEPGPKEKSLGGRLMLNLENVF
jgi:hypothetical protein